ncbi:MAG: RNA methyltransferase [Oscillospiraceae bacterium]
MEHITSRKNRIITHLKSLSTDGAYRREAGEFICDGEKLLREAISCGAKVSCVLWGGEAFEIPSEIEQYSCPAELMQHVSPLKSSQGPVFSVKISDGGEQSENVQGSVLVLENVQDPGNVGTVIRTANALGICAVVLVGDCADLYNPKTVRASMGAIFRQRVLEVKLDALSAFISENGLRLYGAALSETAEDIRNTDMKKIAVAVGSEGRGLSEALLSLCDGQLIIPMQPGSESLNAAVAASIIMWEMRRTQ